MNVVAYASANASNTYMAIIMSCNRCGSISIKYIERDDTSYFHKLIVHMVYYSLSNMETMEMASEEFDEQLGMTPVAFSLPIFTRSVSV
jgi:hypothetical protein